MSKGFKKVLGFAAAVIAPFAAPAIAGAIGISGALGTALVGAGIGGIGAGIAGANPLVGGLLGGLGTFAASGALGRIGASGAAASGTKAGGLFDLFSGPAPGSSASILGTAPGAAGATGVAAGVAGAAGGAPASGGLLSKVLGNVGPSQLARLTLLASGGLNGSGLSGEEKRLVALRRQELQQLATTNEGLFRRQLAEAQKLLASSSQFAPQNVAATAESGVAARLNAEQDAALRNIDPRNTGLRTAERRRFSIARGGQRAAAFQAGLQSGASEQARLASVGLSALPRSAPEKYAGLLLPLQQGISERRRQAQADRARLFGGLFA